jgi:hypothetical protein
VILAIGSAMPALAQTTDPCTDPNSGVVCQSTAAVVDGAEKTPGAGSWVGAAFRAFGGVLGMPVVVEEPGDVAVRRSHVVAIGAGTRIERL